jgi:cell division protein FtsX
MVLKWEHTRDFLLIGLLGPLIGWFLFWFKMNEMQSQLQMKFLDLIIAHENLPKKTCIVIELKFSVCF